MLARDIMNQQVITVRPETTIQEAARLLAENHISGLPVVNEENELVGIVSEADLIYRNKKLKMPTVINLLGGFIYLDSLADFEEELTKMMGTQVKDVMTQEVYATSEDTPVEEIATLMIEKGINRVPVVRDGKLVGIISRADLVRSMVGK